MSRHIQKTKKRLSLAFSLIVFCVVLVLGIAFFSIKYYKEWVEEKEVFVSMVQVIKNKEIPLRSFERVTNRIEGKIMGRHERGERLNILKPEIGFVNYIHLGRNNLIISSNIKEYIDESILESLLEHSSDIVVEHSGFLLAKIDVGNGETFIIFKSLGY